MFGKKPAQKPAEQKPAQKPTATHAAVTAAARAHVERGAKQLSALKQGSVALSDIIAPSSVEVDFKNIRVGERYFRTFFIADYPRSVSPIIIFKSP